MRKGLYTRARDRLLQSALLTRPVDALIRYAERTPYTHLDGYMLRFWVVQPSRWTFGLGLRLHIILRSDNDRDMHTHPWWFVSLILRGTYWEVLPGELGQPGVHQGGYVNLNEPFRIEQRKPGHLCFHTRRTRHKLMLFRGSVTTLVLTGRDHGSWGYQVPGVGLIDRYDYDAHRAQEAGVPQ